ncbi:hypothetical protein [Streptomyces sp. NEAU-S7GS2]|nr:hypothetical protein [Streptomyces sp. NEAU-S7GS2]
MLDGEQVVQGLAVELQLLCEDLLGLDGLGLGLGGLDGLLRHGCPYLSS